MMSFKQFIDEDVRKMPDGGFGVMQTNSKLLKLKAAKQNVSV